MSLIKGILRRKVAIAVRKMRNKTEATLPNITAIFLIGGGKDREARAMIIALSPLKPISTNIISITLSRRSKSKKLSTSPYKLNFGYLY